MSNHTVNRYSDEDLAEFKFLIEDKLAKAKIELDFMRDQILELNENSSDQQGGDWFDDSSIHTELEMLNNQVIRQQQFVRNLENALIRIQNKTYGICIVTGELIEKKRLLAVPHATKSVAAKEDKPQPAPIYVDRSEEFETKREPVEISRTPKVITKVIRKSAGNKPAKPKAVEDDDDFDWDLIGADDDIAVNADDDFGSNIISSMDFEDIADDHDAD